MAYQFDDLLHPRQPKSASGSRQPGQAAGQPASYGAGTARMSIIPDVNRMLVHGDYIHDNLPPCNYSAPQEPHLTFVDANRRGFSLDASMLSKHLLLLGGIGSGKTNVFNFIVESLINQQKPEDLILIFDTKGDYCRRFYQNYNSNHIVIGNGANYADVTRSWNIFGELEDARGRFTSADMFTAKEIGKQLFEGRGSETQPFFSMAAADLVTKVLIDFERTAAADGRRRLNNPELVKWFQSARLKDYIAMLERNPDFASAQLYFGDPGQGDAQRLTAQALGVFGYINAMINDLFTGIFAEDSPCGTFSMRDLVRNRGRNGGKTVVFLEYDLATGEVLSPMYRLLIDLALKEALSQNGRRHGNVYLIIDEFKLLPRLMHIDDALNFGRSLGVRVMAGVQSIDQIYNGYGQERGGAILSGFMNCFGFYTPDSHSRQYLRDRFGENCTHLLYRALNEPVSFQREGHALEDWDIRNFRTGEAAVDLVGQKPFLFRFLDFDDPHQIY